MLNDEYFYNASVRKTIAVFGSLFNNIYTGKLISGKLSNVSRVPLAYGPRERFLVRIRDADNSNNSEVAIRLPRMSFEITSFSYDAAGKLNRNNSRTLAIAGENNSKMVVREAVPYLLGIQLSILADNQDSGLQILEQILPTFNPEYTVSVKDMEGPGTKTDVPIVLNGVTLQDDYEGDFESGRRSIIYTLDFIIKIKFIGATIANAKIIKDITVTLISGDACNPNTTPDDRIHITLGNPETDTEDNFTTITTFGFD